MVAPRGDRVATSPPIQVLVPIDFRAGPRDKGGDEPQRVWTAQWQYEIQYAERGSKPRHAMGQEAFMATHKTAAE